MNEDILKGKWNQLKGEVKKEWGKLTDNDLNKVDGEITRLMGVIQEKYGHTADEIKQKVNKFLARLKEDEKEDE